MKKKRKEGNIHSRAGLREYQISGMCEFCYEQAFAGMDDEDC